MNSDKKSNPYILAGAIIVAGLIISAAIFFRNSDDKKPVYNPADSSVQRETTVSGVRPVSAEDHIMGSIDASVKLIEYSDLECPFCKQFHLIMKQIMAEYVTQGKVVWVYRHFPIESMHSQAPKEAEATECAAQLGGNEKFWYYIDRLFAATPSNDGLNLALLPQIAADIGLDENQFKECLDSGRHAQRVIADFNEAVNSGGMGTPYIVIASGSTEIPFNGALPYEQIKIIIEQLLRQ